MRKTSLSRISARRTLAAVFAIAGFSFGQPAVGLERPGVPYPRTGGRQGLHGEELGHMLAEMQSVQRAYPGLTW